MARKNVQFGKGGSHSSASVDAGDPPFYSPPIVQIPTSPSSVSSSSSSSPSSHPLVKAEALAKAQQDVEETMGRLELALIKLIKLENEQAADAKCVATTSVKTSRLYRELNCQTVRHLDTLHEYLGLMLATKAEKLEVGASKIFGGDESRIRKLEDVKRTIRVAEDAKSCATREYERIKEKGLRMGNFSKSFDSYHGTTVIACGCDNGRTLLLAADNRTSVGSGGLGNFKAYDTIYYKKIRRIIPRKVYLAFSGPLVDADILYSRLESEIDTWRTERNLELNAVPLSAVVHLAQLMFMRTLGQTSASVLIGGFEDQARIYTISNTGVLGQGCPMVLGSGSPLVAQGLWKREMNYDEAMTWMWSEMRHAARYDAYTGNKMLVACLTDAGECAESIYEGVEGKLVQKKRIVIDPKEWYSP